MQQNPHGYGASLENNLEVAIGRQARAFRKNLGMTVVEVSRLANLSPGMLSKIEHGQTSPSLSTLQNLAKALNVPVTSLFRQFEEERDASFVKAGEGIEIERRGTRAGHHYRLLGHTVGGTLNVAPYLITLSKESDVFPIFQHAGAEFVHLLEGALDYRHGDQIYSMTPGDSLFFDADAPHGPENLTKLPIKFLSIISYPSGESTD